MWFSGPRWAQHLHVGVRAVAVGALVAIAAALPQRVKAQSTDAAALQYVLTVKQLQQQGQRAVIADAKVRSVADSLVHYLRTDVAAALERRDGHEALASLTSISAIAKAFGDTVLQTITDQLIIQVTEAMKNHALEEIRPFLDMSIDELERQLALERPFSAPVEFTISKRHPSLPVTVEFSFIGEDPSGMTMISGGESGPVFTVAEITAEVKKQLSHFSEQEQSRILELLLGKMDHLVIK